MPSRKKKYNARFPAGRIKKIMQSDEEIGKVAKAVPVIISKTLELFVESILRKTLKITNSRNYKTLSPSHLKQCIMAEQKFDFLRELVKNVPDISIAEADGNYQDDDTALTSSDDYQDSDTPSDLSKPSTSNALQQSKPPVKSLNLQQNSINGNEKRNPQDGPRRIHHYQNGHGSQANITLTNNNNYNVTSVPTTSSLSSMKRDAGVLQRFQQRIDSKSVTATITSGAFSNATSVIKHTKSLEVSNAVDQIIDDIPNKIARSDSTPGIAFSSFTNDNHSTNTATAIASASAIPSSILNYDFSHKSVQLDYSKIGIPVKGKSLKTTADSLSPSSSGSSCGASTSKTAFDFSQPVINIDLSNLVPPITNSTNSNNSNNNKKASELKTPIGTIATISASAAAEMPIATISIGSKPKGGPSSSASMLTPKLSTSLELDEDYDNI